MRFLIAATVFLAVCLGCSSDLLQSNTTLRDPGKSDPKLASDGTPIPPGGCEVKSDEIIYSADGSVWGCVGGGNWCSEAKLRPGVCGNPDATPGISIPRTPPKIVTTRTEIINGAVSPPAQVTNMLYSVTQSDGKDRILDYQGVCDLDKYLGDAGSEVTTRVDVFDDQREQLTCLSISNPM